MTHSALTRLARANPVASQHRTDHKLFASIVRSPGDDRQLARPSRLRITPGRTLVGVALVALSTGAAWVSLSNPSPPPSPLQAFRQNLAASGAPNPVDHQRVIASTVRLAATARIPDVGPVQYWTASSQPGGVCWGLRLPNHSWLGVPGCLPVHTADTAYPGHINEFGEGDVFAAGTDWRVWSGYVMAPLRAVRITDLVSGRSTPIQNGRYFALAIPDSSPHTLHVRLVAYGRDGRPVASFPAG